MTDRIITREISAHHAWQGPESKAPVCNDGPQLEALAEAGQQMPHVVYEPYPGAFDHLLGAESNMQEPHTAPSGDLISREAAQQPSPVAALRQIALETLAECDEGYCLSLKGFLSRCETPLHPEIVRGVMADLRQDGLVAHCRGLMTEDGEMAGSGWGITPAGEAYLRTLSAQGQPVVHIHTTPAVPAVKVKRLVWRDIGAYCLAAEDYEIFSKGDQHRLLCSFTGGGGYYSSL